MSKELEDSYYSAKIKKLLTAKDIQDIFSMGKNQAYALMHSAGFPSITVGNRLYVEESHLKKWIDTYSGRRYVL